MKRLSFYTMIWIAAIAVFSLQCHSDKNPAGSDNKDQQSVQTVETISAMQAKTFIDENNENPDFIIIDVRTPGEYLPEHIEGAINIDFYNQNFETQINQLDKSKTYLIYCRSGSRSGQVLTFMQAAEFQTIYNLEGGINAWNNAGYPTVV